jgi:hypothetical protein
MISLDHLSQNCTLHSETAMGEITEANDINDVAPTAEGLADPTAPVTKPKLRARLGPTEVVILPNSDSEDDDEDEDGFVNVDNDEPGAGPDFLKDHSNETEVNHATYLITII